MNLKTIHTLLLAFISIITVAQGKAASDTVVCKVPLNRQIFHDEVDAAQKSAAGSAEVQSAVDNLQCEIERDTLISGQDKVRYLRGIQGLLGLYVSDKRTFRSADAVLKESIAIYSSSVRADARKRTIETFINAGSYEAGSLVTRGARIALEKNSGFKKSSDHLVLKYCSLYPDQTFQTLKANPDVPFADSLIKAVARTYPSQLYTYAQANNKLGYRIRNIVTDPFIKTVVQMSRSKSGQMYFPFLDNVVKGKTTLAELDAAEKDSVKYFRLLVNTRIDYVQRARDKDTAIAYAELETKLIQKASDVFVTTINGLHERPDAVRFKILQSLTPQELYYLAVSTDGLIYTSSYTNGVYPLMMKKINNRGDSLLQLVKYDHYRKFISQAAAYNTLRNFLGSYPDGAAADELMKRFVTRLEESSGLEDGVDVADSYASIAESLPERAKEMLKNVQANLERTEASGDRRGVAIYTILDKLFRSADSTSNIDLTKELNIPPVYKVPFSALTNDKGEVIVQVFFFGDEDGKTDFRIFQSMFPKTNWSIDRSNKQWMIIRSVKEKPVVIYANVPFDEETGEDDRAQSALRDYLQEKNLLPTVTINRGHSYHANTTIAYMAPTSRLVFMGSCGGFNLINAILKKSGDAHIVASKQIGKRDINKPFIQLLTEKLRLGQDIDWIPFWKEFRKNANVDGFDDYIPPHKNLGVIFIKAYNRSMETASSNRS
ncbi:hypothetical protein LZZ85_09505 [Terrimonas sp. NA20]|uniref:Uncharacterized protein n=1 Tax=Terrimonas ginsenosidimutans TaxID=2908004 RepID=A0ABS9KQC1_9BACT|nr:hypothetical protein [Terrimonas ginsenosidimutans]MCG2614517.1 hypothetical protein [Terrimonas ginsenosidimutans]